MSAEPAFDDGPQPIDRFDWQRIIRRLEIASGVKYLALMLATYADPDGTRVHPGVKRLARVMDVSEPTVKRSMAVLRSLGLVVLVKQGNRWANQADEYRLTVPMDLLELPMLDPNESAESADRL
jgi:DNA-binding transcriptional ArsR family regulator